MLVFAELCKHVGHGSGSIVTRVGYVSFYKDRYHVMERQYGQYSMFRARSMSVVMWPLRM